MILPLIYYPDKLLNIQSYPVETVDITLVNDMIDTMLHHKGIGLAAIQVGKPVQLIVMVINGSPEALINPKILAKSPNRHKFNEGCLSFQNEKYLLYRANKVKISYNNIKGKKIYKELVGLEATCFQHEYDHLLGITMKDRADE